MRVAPLLTLLAAATRGDVDAVARMDARLDALLKADPAWLGTFEADAYATDWARATDKRCAAANCSWAGGFGPIDVDCRLRVDAAGLEQGGPGPRATFEFHDKTTLTITAETAADEKRFVSRPALCEYIPERGDPGDAALLMVANSPSYLMRLWPQLLNKLLYATDAGLRPFVWVGELPPRLAKPERLCLESLPAQLAKKGVDARFPDHRRLKSRHQSYYDGKYHMPSDATFVSNHYVKMPATIATLAAPGVTGLYYVDLDAVVQHPWTIPSDLLAEHRANLSDVSFGIMDSLRWKVHGSRFYVRDTRRGRDFFAAWFRHRCTFKDQYSLWHTILSMAGREGCIDYEGELYARFTYRMARHAKLHKVPAPLALTCEAIDARCPGWRFSNTGGAQCRPGLHQSPKLLPQIFHHSEQQTFPLSVMYEDRSYAMVVESACFEGRRRRDPARCPANYSAYVAGLGVDARDRRRHPWQARAATYSRVTLTSV